MNYEVYEVYSQNNEKHFQFTTSNQITYLIKISKAEFRFETKCLSCSNIEEIAFFPVGEDNFVFDPYISNTIIKFIKKYIELYSVPLIFMCDSIDNREKSRFYLFNRWFLRNDSYKEYKYETRIYEFDSYTLYCGILAKKSESNFDQYFNELDLTLY